MIFKTASNQWTAISAIENAIESWDSIDPDSLSITYDGEDFAKTNHPNDGVNVIFWAEHSSLGNFSGFALLTASLEEEDLGRLIDVDIVLNDKKYWTLNAASCSDSTRDVQSTVTHELGHALGLGHARGRNTMTNTYGYFHNEGWCEAYVSAYEDSLQMRIVSANDQDGYEQIYVINNNIRSLRGSGGGQKPVATAPFNDRLSAETLVFPNPFNAEVTLVFSLAAYGTVGGSL